MAADRFGWSVVAITLGALVVGAAAGPAVGAAPAAPLAWLLFVGSSMHVAATLGLFSFPEVRACARANPVRYLLTPAALLAAAIAACLLLPAGAEAIGLLAFFCWQLWHYQKQNLGLASLALASAHLPPLGPVERRCIRASGAGGVLALVADPGLLQIVAWHPPTAVASTVHALAALVLGGSLVAATVATVRRRLTATATSSAAAVYAAVVAFPIPLVLTHAPYAALGGLTLAHGLQYLLLVGHVVAGPPAQRRKQADVTRLLAIGALVVATAGVLGALSHLHSGTQLPARVLFGAYLAAVMTHFVVDAGLWRLRDEFPRRWLTARAPQLLGAGAG